MHSTLLLILITVLILLLLSIVGISAVVACILKEKKQLLAVDVLLISATLLIAATLCIGLVPHDKKLKRSSQLQKAYKICDRAVSSIDDAKFMETMDEPWRSIMYALAGHKVDKELADAETAVRNQADSFPGSQLLSARLAIILHAEKKDTRQIFDELRESTSKPQLLVALQDLYENESSQQLLPAHNTEGPSPIHEEEHKGKDTAKSADDGAQTKYQKYKDVIKNSFEDGWFRETALIDLYSKYDPEALKVFHEKQAKIAEQWRFRVQAFLIAEAVVLPLGCIAIICFFKNKPTNTSEFVPFTSKFRRMYACLLSNIFAQTLAGGAFGFWIGISSVLYHTSSDITKYEFAMTAVLTLAGAFFCWLLFYLLVLRPQNLSVNQAFTRSAPRMSAASFITYCVGGFFAGNLVNTVVRFLYRLIPNTGRPTNPAQLEMVSAFVAGDLGRILWSVALGCLIAPVTEEIMFRGFLFGWLRNRIGAPGAILVSSAIFALWHFDPNGFVQYFALGAVCGTVYNRTRNLWISILIHGLWNFWVISTVWWITSIK